VERAGLHTACIDCGDRTGHSIGPSADGIWLFKCHRCGVAGSIVDADLAASGGTVADAIKRLGVDAQAAPRIRITAPPAPRREPMQPTCDAQKVYAIFAPAFANVIEGRANDRLKARGIHFREWFASHPILGWDANFKAWVLLVTDANWNYLGLKIHRERPFTGPKNFWLKCGSQPPENPRHAATGAFWPPVEIFDRDELLYLCPGELKAAAILSAGDAATSTCAGESHQWTPGQIELFRDREIALLYDDDAAGIAYRDRTFSALCCVANQIYKISLGAKSNDE